jgi:hypothetical protein
MPISARRNSGRTHSAEGHAIRKRQLREGERTRQLSAVRPTEPTAQDEALLDAVPDQQVPPDELTELFAVFDLTATYDKNQRALRLAATLSADLVPPLDEASSRWKDQSHR